MSIVDRIKKIWELSAEPEHDSYSFEMVERLPETPAGGVTTQKEVFIPRVARDPVKEIVNEQA